MRQRWYAVNVVRFSHALARLLVVLAVAGLPEGAAPAASAFACTGSSARCGASAQALRDNRPPAESVTSRSGVSVADASRSAQRHHELAPARLALPALHRAGDVAQATHALTPAAFRSSSLVRGPPSLIN